MTPDRNAMMKRLRRFGVNVGLALVVFGVAHAWQTKDLLAGAKAPTFQLRDLAGSAHALGAQQDPRPRRTLLYFFAPWCGVCKLSIGNLNTLRQLLGDDVAIYAVALSYATEASVRDFAAQHELDVPVLLGDDQVLDAYKISAFPTYYVVDQNGEVVHTDVGYSTTLGMRLRLL